MDEARLKSPGLAADPCAMAVQLAEAKAVSLANRIPDALVIGADQVLNVDGIALDKPETIDAARRQLERLRGREHWLETAICCARETTVPWRYFGRARLV